MTQILKRALPFILAFVFGVMITAVIGRISPVRQHRLFDHGRCNWQSRAQTASAIRRIAIESVPDADFPEAIKKREPTYGRVKLIAVFDASGSVKSVRPYPMIPFGVSESAVGVDEFAGVTPFMVDGNFVNSLPDGLTELAIQQVSGIGYKPKTLNGQPISQTVFVLTDYGYSESSRYASGCSRIEVTIMDDTGVLWEGNTWVSRNVGCVLI